MIAPPPGSCRVCSASAIFTSSLCASCSESCVLVLLHYCTVCTILLNLVGHDRMLLAEKAVAGMLPARIGALARACSAVQCRVAASPPGTTARVSAHRVPYGSCNTWTAPRASVWVMLSSDHATRSCTCMLRVAPQRALCTTRSGASRAFGCWLPPRHADPLPRRAVRAPVCTSRAGGRSARVRSASTACEPRPSLGSDVIEGT